MADPKFQPILFKVKEQSGINTISINRVGTIASSILINAPSNESALIARQLIEIHFKQQLKLFSSQERLHKIENDLFQAQGDMASGHLVEFKIDPNLIGVIIGKKGTRIRQIESETGVQNISVQDNGVVKIIGNDSVSVQRAREQMELVEQEYELSDIEHDYYTRDGTQFDGSLNDVKEVSGLIIIRFRREDAKLILVGTRSSVQSAKILLATQLEYIQEQAGIRSSELAARERLYEIKKQYGFSGNGGGGDRGGGRGDRGGERGGRGDGDSRRGPRRDSGYGDDDGRRSDRARPVLVRPQSQTGSLPRGRGDRVVDSAVDDAPKPRGPRTSESDRKTNGNSSQSAAVNGDKKSIRPSSATTNSDLTTVNAGATVKLLQQAKSSGVKSTEVSNSKAEKDDRSSTSTKVERNKVQDKSVVSNTASDTLLAKLSKLTMDKPAFAQRAPTKAESAVDPVLDALEKRNHKRGVPNTATIATAAPASTPVSAPASSRAPKAKSVAEPTESVDDAKPASAEKSRRRRAAGGEGASSASSGGKKKESTGLMTLREAREAGAKLADN